MSSSYAGKRTIFMSLALVLLMAIIVLRIIDPGPVRSLRNAYFDYLQILAPRPYTPLPVAIVDLDEGSLSRLGQWPWPRDRMAAMVDRLADFGAAVVVFDILFSEADRLSPRNIIRDASVRGALRSGPWVEELDKLDNDVTFSRAMARVPVVLGISDAGEAGAAPGAAKTGVAFLGQDPAADLLPLRSATALVPVLEEAAAGIGVVNINPLTESDTLRDVPLVWTTPEGAMPGLAVEALRVALGEGTLVVTGPDELPPRADGLRIGGYTVPTTAHGLFPVWFRHDEPGQYIPAWRLLDDNAAADLAPQLQGAIVFIGSSAAGLADTRSTALGERVPGVSIHAQVVEQILLETYLTRTDTTQAIEILLLAAIGIMVSLVLMLTGPVPSVIAGGVAAAAVLGASWYGFTREGILLDATYPLIGGFVAFSALALYQFAISDREKRMIRRSFARYVAPSVLSEIEKQGGSIELGGTTGEVTVLFSDIRNFTPLSATMSAQDLVALLNELFTDLSEEILAEAGTIDKYIGDEIMAFWNAPLVTPGHQRRACLATLRMRRAMERYNTRKAASGTAPIAIGMGLDCGLACVGNIGSRSRFNYTAIGDTVNVAARTQSACRHVAYDILVTAEVAGGAPDLAFLPAGSIELKGVSDRVQTFILVGAAAMAVSRNFGLMRQRFEALIAAIREGRPDVANLLAEAEQAADAVDPNLRPFLNRCLNRAADFA
jgi:adenylate cyclase